jgi:hypothetical protein
MPTASAMDTLICVTTNKTFSVNAVPTAVNYTWTLPAGFTDSSKTTSILIHPVSPGGIITVTANNACGSSTPLVRPLTVYTAPATLPVITGNSAVCTNTTNTYSVTPAPAVTTSYTWCNLPSGCVTNTNPTCSYLKTSNYTVSVTYSNVCGSKTLTKSVTVTPLPTAANNLNWVIPLCPNSSKQFNSSGSANATSYTWTYPADWTGPTTTTTGSNTFTIGEISGNVTVKANNSCGSSAVYSEYVNAVGPPPTVSNISGPTVVCYDSTYTYSVAQSAQIVSYYWSIPSGWTALSSILQHQVTIKPGPNGGVIQAKGSNGACSAGPYQSLSVNVQCAPVNTSIDELTETGTFILPNPSTGILHISSPYQSYKNLAVYSLTGSLVYFTTSTETTIDLSDKPKGLYFVHVLETNNRKAVYKIILE